VYRHVDISEFTEHKLLIEGGKLGMTPVSRGLDQTLSWEYPRLTHI
jgi:hypothetical protein